ncbi:MAG: ABC transporter substrate-binding protein [Candidatus Desulforudis sp.]|nr:ABC transporter substrate-binding protein [Desulforudis sp.]
MSFQLKALFLIPALVTCLLLGTLTGCGIDGREPAAGTSEPERLASYVIADPNGDWGFPSPFSHYQRGPGYIRMSLIFETLIWKDAADFVPALAGSWDYDASANAYRFELRDDVTWHDGRPFTADDVVFTFQYLKAHPYPFADTDVVESVTADGNVLTITLSRPYAPFLETVAGTVPILPRHVWHDVADPEGFRTPEAAVGTGPFKYGDYNKEQGTYLYPANPDYYGGEVLVRELRFVKVTEEMTAAALRNGQVQAGSITPEMAAGLEESGFTVITSPYYWNAKLMINHQREPLAQKEVRRALAYAVDRREIVELAQRGHALAGSSGLIPPDSEWFAPQAHQYPYDPARAAALLEGSGYRKEGAFYARDGKTLELELIYSGGGAGSTNFTRDAELLKQQLERTGIKVNLRSMEAKTVDDRVLNWNFDLAVSGHGGLGGDPLQLNRAIIGAGFNSARYEADEELSAVLNQQLLTMDKQERLALVQEAQALYVAEVPALTLYYPNRYFAHDGRIDLYYTRGGVALGVPVAINRMAFVR